MMFIHLLTAHESSIIFTIIYQIIHILLLLLLLVIIIIVTHYRMPPMYSTFCSSFEKPIRLGESHG